LRATAKPGLCKAQVIGRLNLAAGLGESKNKFRKVYQEVDDVPALEPVTSGTPWCTTWRASPTWGREMGPWSSLSSRRLPKAGPVIGRQTADFRRCEFRSDNSHTAIDIVASFPGGVQPQLQSEILLPLFGKNGSFDGTA
jgi:hypothetical protein